MFRSSYAFWVAHLGYKSEWAFWEKENILCFWRPVVELELNQMSMGRHEQNMTEDWELADRAFSLKRGPVKERSHRARWNLPCEKQDIQQFSYPAVQPSSPVEKKMQSHHATPLVSLLNEGSHEHWTLSLPLLPWLHIGSCKDTLAKGDIKSRKIS